MFFKKFYFTYFLNEYIFSLIIGINIQWNDSENSYIIPSSLDFYALHP